jgi:demethylmenaquinone methyltransferase/2-methoxy-6-polyprenyl-1,4-benzoquinol methylase
MSKEKIDAHHKGSAIHVSNGLMEADELADIFNEYLEVTTVLSDDNMYQVVGMKL